MDRGCRVCTAEICSARCGCRGTQHNCSWMGPAEDRSLGCTRASWAWGCSVCPRTRCLGRSHVGHLEPICCRTARTRSLEFVNRLRVRPVDSVRSVCTSVVGCGVVVCASGVDTEWGTPRCGDSHTRGCAFAGARDPKSRLVSRNIRNESAMAHSCGFACWVFIPSHGCIWVTGGRTMGLSPDCGRNGRDVERRRSSPVPIFMARACCGRCNISACDTRLVGCLSALWESC